MYILREFANVPSSWLGRGVSRFGTGIRVTISLREPWEPTAPAKVDRDGSLDAGSFKNEMPPLKFELGEKSISKCQKSHRFFNISFFFMPQTMLPAMVVFLKPRCQRCRDSKILVTMAFWEAHSRHAGELSVFFLAKKLSYH